MPHYYKAQWEWFCESPDRCYWRAPGGNAVGAVDLRSNNQSGKSGGVPDGFGVFAYEEPQTLNGAEYLGTDGSTVAEMVWTKLTTEADPKGETAPKPLTGKLGNDVVLYIGGERLKSEPFTEEHKQRTIDVFQADYRKNAGRYPKGLLQKWVGAKMEEIYGEKSDEKAALLVPAEHQKGKLWKEPATTITDAFTDTNGVNLESHNTGFSWSKLTSDTSLEIQSNKLQAESGGNHDRDYRADSDLSTDDMYAKATVGTTSTDFDGAVDARFSSSARTHYQVEYGNGFYRIARFEAGVRTVMQEAGASNSAGDVVEIRVNGSTVQAFKNGSQIGTDVTDTNITGHLRAGLNAWHEQTTWDTFEAGDLGGATVTPSIMLMGIGT